MQTLIYMPRTLLTTSICTAALLAGFSAALAADNHLAARSTYRAPQAAEPLVIDGVADETVWQQAEWRDLNQRWLGPEYTAADFQGRYKVAWSGTRIYLLAEIVDDVLLDTHRDPLVQYWDDDCLEVFLDEDFSGGNHQYNHNAFAYHFSLDNRAIDIGTDERARDYSHHVESNWKQVGDKIIWEVAIDVYTDAYIDDSETNTPVMLAPGKVMGLMVAYCDNDGSELRENFIGSEFIPGEQRDRGWIDADVFGELILIK